MIKSSTTAKYLPQLFTDPLNFSIRVLYLNLKLKSLCNEYYFVPIFGIMFQCAHIIKSLSKFHPKLYFSLLDSVSLVISTGEQFTVIFIVYEVTKSSTVYYFSDLNKHSSFLKIMAQTKSCNIFVHLL